MPDEIADTEALYRRVPDLPGFYSYDAGDLRLSSSAFNDREGRPSVDRALLLGNDPRRARTDPAQGVVALHAGQVRAIDDVDGSDPRGKAITRYRIDVRPDPLPDRPAHALIVSSPEFQSKSSFKRLKERLARLASRDGWLLPPQSLSS